MLSINSVARVVVNAVRSAASPAAFDTGLLLVQDSSYAEARRLQSYDSAEAAAAGLTALGFASTSEVCKSAVKYFGASPSPQRKCCVFSTRTVIAASINPTSSALTGLSLRSRPSRSSMKSIPHSL